MALIVFGRHCLQDIIDGTIDMQRCGTAVNKEVTRGTAYLIRYS